MGGQFVHPFYSLSNITIMTVLEIRFMEQLPRELRRINENLEEIINLLKSKENGTNNQRL